MKRYMLDTNMVSLALKPHPEVLARMLELPMASLCISAVTQAELMYGLAKRPQAHRLHRSVHEFLMRVEVLPFDSRIAAHYGAFRAGIESLGKSLSSLDMMIAAHAQALQAILVSHDRAFAQIDGLALEDWTGVKC